jgi:hypothetical protein
VDGCRCEQHLPLPPARCAGWFFFGVAAERYLPDILVVQFAQLLPLNGWINGIQYRLYFIVVM